MTVASPTPPAGGQPLVAVVCSVPLIYEALSDAIGSIADVRSFPAARGTAGLLRWLRPDAVIVDNDDEVPDAEVFAREFDLPLVHISLRDKQIKVFHNGTWLSAGSGEGPTAELVRNVIAGGLYGRGRA